MIALLSTSMKYQRTREKKQHRRRVKEASMVKLLFVLMNEYRLWALPQALAALERRYPGAVEGSREKQIPDL